MLGTFLLNSLPSFCGYAYLEPNCWGAYAVATGEFYRLSPVIPQGIPGFLSLIVNQVPGFNEILHAAVALSNSENFPRLLPSPSGPGPGRAPRPCPSHSERHVDSYMAIICQVVSIPRFGFTLQPLEDPLYLLSSSRHFKIGKFARSTGSGRGRCNVTTITNRREEWISRGSLTLDRLRI